MKQRLLYIFMFLCCFSNTYASEDGWQLSLQGENLDHGEAASLRIHTGDYLYGGLSLNYIDSDTVIQQGNRNTIYPLFLFMGLKYPARITPFIEGALDLPEALIDEAVDDEENAIDLTDYYLSAGLEIAITEKYSLTVYAKKYVFKYHETILTSTQKVRMDSVGAGITVRF